MKYSRSTADSGASNVAFASRAALSQRRSSPRP
ncbi:hypothetical protein J2X68_002992 [Streptomyces sp. 3330]|nr:hypothetical protein [Streptomyces sp. 3330]